MNTLLATATHNRKATEIENKIAILATQLGKLIVTQKLSR